MSDEARDEDQPVVSIKGFKSDLTCRGYQFAVGQTYTHEGSVEQCESGFHACPVEHHPLSMFGFYPPAGSRYFEVRQSGARSNGGTKLASSSITIDFELTIGDLVKHAWDYVWSRATKSDEAHVTIEYGAASATGYRGAASATGPLGAAMASGCAGKVMGAAGCAIFAVERDTRHAIVSVAAGVVGQDGIQAGAWYVAKSGSLVAAAA